MADRNKKKFCFFSENDFVIDSLKNIPTGRRSLIIEAAVLSFLKSDEGKLMIELLSGGHTYAGDLDEKKNNKAKDIKSQAEIKEQSDTNNESGIPYIPPKRQMFE